MPVTPSFPISYEGVLSHLVGLDSWLEAAALSRRKYNQTYITNTVLPAAFREFERKSNYRITLTQIVTRPDQTYTGTVTLYTNPATGAQTEYTVPVIERDANDLYTQQMMEYFAVRPYEHPIQHVQRVRIMLNNLLVYELPPSWYSLDKRTGKFQILPVYGPLLVTNVLNLFVLNATMKNLDYIPNCLCMDYVAGLLPTWTTDPEYADLLRNIEEYCALKILKDVQELADAGLLSVGTNGEQRQYSRFKERRDELTKDTTEYVDFWNAQENALLVGWV